MEREEWNREEEEVGGRMRDEVGGLEGGRVEMRDA